MTPAFKPDGLPALIGSLPLSDHDEALDWVLRHTPEIPLWAQLPTHAHERMLPQFQAGMPGLAHHDGKTCVDVAGADFEEQLAAFYQEYLEVTEGQRPLADSRFAMTPQTAPGLFTLLKRLPELAPPPRAIKGQVTGPVTFGIGVTDAQGRAIFYDLPARDAAIKLLALRARWQAERLAAHQRPVMIFVDEPGLTGLGSSAMIGCSNDEVRAALEEVFEAIHAAGALAGIHVCGNTDWALILGSATDVVSFDAFGFMDRFLLYAEPLRAYLASGRLLALGVVPTANAADVQAATADSISELLQQAIDGLAALGFERPNVIGQCLVTPSCGTGSLSPELARKVLELTREVSIRLRR